MKWDFTPQDVLQGRAECTIGHFREMLRHDVMAQFPDTEAGHADHLYHLIYDICYWLATGSTLSDLIEFYGGSPADMKLLNIIEERYQDSIDILQAIIQRRYASGVDAGLTQAEALAYLIAK